MNCTETQLRISTYLDSALDAADVSPMFLHLGGCPACREFIRSLLRLRSSLTALPTEEVPRSLDRRILAMAGAIGRARKAPLLHLRELWTRRLAFPLPAAAALALIALGGALLSLSLWFGSAPPKEQVVYVLSMPVVEVHAPQSTTSATIR